MKKNKEHKEEIKYTRAIIYCRVSSDKQVEEGHGLDGQERRCRDYAEKKGYQVDRVFKDAYSGGGDYMDRPNMSELIAFLDKRPYINYVVIFDDLKRFARDVKFHLKLREELRARNAIPECPNYNFDDSPEGVFIETVHAAHNQLEREQNKRQVIQKQRARLELGYWAFGARKGYKMIKDPMHGKLCVFNGKETELLKTALEGFSTGIFVRKIDACKFLVENKFWKQSAEKCVDIFTNMLKDSFYAGYIEYPAWEVSRRLGHHKSLISLETFERNQKRLNENQIKKRVRKDVSEDFPLRGLLNCGECKKHLTAAWTKGNGGKYGFYFCQNKECESFRKSINRVRVEKEFKELLINNTLKSEAENLLSLVFDRVWKDEIINQEKRRKEKLQEEKILKEKIEQLTELAIKAKSRTLRDTYETQIEKTASELEDISRTTTEKIDYSVPYQTALDKSKKILKSPYQIWENVDVIEKHKLFFFLFQEKLEYSKKESYRTNKIPSAVMLFEEFATQTTNDVDPTIHDSKPFVKFFNDLDAVISHFENKPIYLALDESISKELTPL